MGEVDQILRFPEVIKATGRSKASLYEMIRAGQFPAPIQIGSKAVGFLAREVAEWQKSRPRVGRGTWPASRVVVENGPPPLAKVSTGWGS